MLHPLSSLRCFVALLLVCGAPQTIAAQDAAAASTQTAESSLAIPRTWLGKWAGQVTAISTAGPSGSFQMELEVAEAKEPNVYTWTITYSGPQGRSERPYLLKVIDASKGHYAIDEQNGVVIDAMKLGDGLYSHFSIQGQTLWTRYEWKGTGDQQEVHFELISAASAEAADQANPVTSLRPANRQIGILRRSEQPTASSPANGPQWLKLNTEAYRGKQDDIYFVNDRVGWYGNGSGKIFKTEDGGETWKQQLAKPGTYFRCLAFLDEQHGFAGNIGPGYFPNVTDSNPLYETKDGGETWTAVTTIEGEPVVGLCAMQVLREEFVNAGKLDVRTRVIGVGRVGGPVAMIISDDLGATWQRIETPAEVKMAFDVHFFNRQEGFIAAATSEDVSQSHALVVQTTDGGKTWKKVYESTRPYELTWKFSFPTRETGYVTIQSYNPDKSADTRFVAKTVDGGLTWQEQLLVQDAAVREFGIGFINERIGWVGAMPHGFETRDGGATWSKIDMGNAVNKIRFIQTDQKTIGFAIGAQVHRIEIPK